MPTFGDHAHGVEKIYKEVVAGAPIFPAYVPDFCRERLEFRRRRLDEVHRYVLDVLRRRADLEAAILGDPAALARVTAVSPEAGRALERGGREKEE